MNPTNNKVILSCDLKQKDTMLIGGIKFSTAIKFDTNYREKSPTIATVVEGNECLNNGDMLLCHHNLFYQPSPYHLNDDLFSIPFSKVLFAKISKDGGISPICGNLICERIPETDQFEVPVSERKMLDKVYKVIDGGWTTYKKGDTIFTRPSGAYDIVYNYDGIEKRVTKVDADQICGVIKINPNK